MTNIIQGQKIYSVFEYNNEADFEKDVIKHIDYIFDSTAIYFDVKRRIGRGDIKTIPDGYLIDFSFVHNPSLHIIENELVTHDPYRHIGQQLLKFAVSYKNSGHEIKRFLLEEISKNKKNKERLNKYLKLSKYRNIDDLLENIIFNKSVGIVVIIDEINDDLSNVLNQLTMKTDILEFKKYINQNDSSDVIYQFLPFQQDIKSSELIFDKNINLERLDTIVVPANEDGFRSVFLGENCWHAIKISSIMLDKIKYIACYQTRPVSAITYVAVVKKIDRYKDTNKYIVYFEEKAKKIKPIKLIKNGIVKAPQGPRYATYKQLIKAKNLDKVF